MRKNSIKQLTKTSAKCLINFVKKNPTIINKINDLTNNNRKSLFYTSRSGREAKKKVIKKEWVVVVYSAVCMRQIKKRNEKNMQKIEEKKSEVKNFWVLKKVEILKVKINPREKCLKNL